MGRALVALLLLLLLLPSPLPLSLPLPLPLLSLLATVASASRDEAVSAPESESNSASPSSDASPASESAPASASPRQSSDEATDFTQRSGTRSGEKSHTTTAAFMRREFRGRVADAYFAVDPRNGAARADLWRYCVLL